MDERELYLFDLQGFIAIEGALTADEVAELDGLFQARVDELVPPDANTFRFEYPFDWSPAVRRIIDHDRLRPVLEAMLGQGYRLDHDYADLIRHGLGPIGAKLHGGGTPHTFAEWYDFRDGRPRSGLAVVAINLRDVNPGDGGFAAVPGSHKANYAFPADWRDLEVARPFVRPVTGPAGTAVIFTEALTHGTLPWTGAGERRTLFLKFSPAALSWSATWYDADRYPELTDRQRAILEPPNARYGNRRVGTR
jgi:Phytanoyl-CoA dioxygenase (PhyH)